MTGLEEIKSLLEKQSTQINKIHSVLAGDEFNDGLIKEFRTVKNSHYEIKTKVERVGWLASIIGGAIGAISTYLYKFFHS
jgi:hypothetical protein